MGNILLTLKFSAHLCYVVMFTHTSEENDMSICALLPGHNLHITHTEHFYTSSEASDDASDASHILDLAHRRQATNTLNITLFNLTLSNCPIKYINLYMESFVVLTMQVRKKTLKMFS